MNHPVRGTVCWLIFNRSGCAYGASCAASQKVPDLMLCIGPRKTKRLRFSEKGPGKTAYSEHIENQHRLDKRNFVHWEGVLGSDPD